MEDMLGIVETEASFHNSLSSIGKSSKEGKTIAISYVSGTALRFIPLVVRLAVFLALMVLPFYRQPFSALPDFSGMPEWYASFRSWEIFSIGTWALSVVIYLVYFLFTLVVKNGLHRGVPGAEIHFTRYGKIVYTVRPGEVMLIVDPRVLPYAVVSTRLMVVNMPIVENNTRDNITLRFSGALVLRVNDTLKLLQAGGFKNFIRQLSELYTSRMRDEIQKVDAHRFNRFLVEPVKLRDAHVATEESIKDRLAKLSSNTDLSVELIEGLAEIDELNVSQLLLDETSAPERRSIISRLQQLASSYGVEILDHVPGGNRTGDEYLHTLALPLVSSITRLSQATDVLRGIRMSEIEVGIQNHVASRQMLVLQISQIIKAIQSVTRTLSSEEGKKQMADSRRQTMINTTNAILTTQLARIEGLLGRVKAGEVNQANIGLVVRVTEESLAKIEEAVDNMLPDIETVLVSKFDKYSIVPDINVVDEFLYKTGLKDAIDALESDQTGNNNASVDFKSEVDSINVPKTIEDIVKALDATTSIAGISTDQWSPERVEQMISELESTALGASHNNEVSNKEIK